MNEARSNLNKDFTENGMMNVNFDMQELMNLCGQNMMTVNQMSAQMGIVVNKVNSLDKGMSLLTDRMDRFELKSEIDSDQEERLRQAVNRRVAELLHHDPYEFTKYSRRFFARCWSDAKRYGGVAASYKSTKKENYQRALDYIEAWEPNEGCAAFKDKIDEAARLKKKAQDEGYLD